MVSRFLNLIDCFSDALGISVPPIVDIERLRSLPSGTFGRAWADSLEHHNLEPLTTGPRRKQLHDGLHVLTGYGIDPLGEAEVQAFLLATKFRLVHLLLGLGLLRAIHNQMIQQVPLSPTQVGMRLWNAYCRGRYSQFDPDTWQPELLWELPLVEVQKMFHI
jgi:ubiquinone biosynthesis protein COQ4